MHKVKTDLHVDGNISYDGTISGELPISDSSGNIITDSNGLYAKIPDEYIWYRAKNEVVYNNINLSITSTPQNFLSILKTNTPMSGTLDQFFNTTSNKLNVYNINSSVFFKLSLTGTWGSGNNNLGVTITFPPSNGNTLIQSRNPGAASDTLTFATFFSIDANGNIVTNGADIIINTFNNSFNVTSISLIADQMINPNSVLSVK